MSQESKRQYEQRRLIKRFEHHVSIMLVKLGNNSTHRDDLDCRLEYMTDLLDRITITEATRDFPNTLKALRVKVENRGKVTVEPNTWTTAKPKLWVVS